MSVLLVEDHLSTRLAMQWLLNDAGFVVTEAGTVAEAIAAVAGQRIALLDLDLPDGLGTEVMLHIREQSGDTRVAFITSETDAERIANLVARADAVFEKPASFDAILQWINQVNPM